jgi:hypothetical protein
MATYLPAQQAYGQAEFNIWTILRRYKVITARLLKNSKFVYGRRQSPATTDDRSSHGRPLDLDLEFHTEIEQSIAMRGT